MSLLSYLLAIFCSPLFFLLRKRWIAFILHSILYVIAIICIATVVLAPVGMVIWPILLHAVLGLRRDDMNERAELMASKMAAAMQKESSR